jgi:putative methionine-R-sulfoxide reductase with GAF domain
MTLSDPKPSTAPAMDTKARNAFWIATLIALVIGPTSLYLFRLADVQSAREYVPFTGLWIITLTAILAAVLSRLGRVTLGMSVLIGALMLGNLTVAFVTIGFGLLAGSLTFVATAAIAAYTFPQRSISRAIISALVVSILTVLIDLFGPSTGRLGAGSDVIGISQVMVGIITLAFGLFTLRQFATFTLRTKLIALFLAVSLTPVALLSYLNYQSTRTTLLSNTDQSLLAAASQTALTVDTFIGTTLDSIRTDAQLPNIVGYLSLPATERTGSTEEAAALDTLRVLSKLDALNISSYAILDANGLDVLDTFPTDIGVEKANRDYFQGPMKSHLPYVSPFELSRTTLVSSIYFSAPIRDANRVIIGILRVRYSGTVLQQLLSKNNGVVGEGSFATLLDENQIRLVNSLDPSLNLKSVAPLAPELVAQLQKAERLPNGTANELSTKLPGFSQALLQADTQPFFATALNTGLQGDPTQQAAVVKLTNQPWYLVYGVPQSVALAPVEAQSRNNTLLALAVIVVVAVVAIAGAQLLAAPINRLTLVAEKVRAGNLDTHAKVESQDEIGILAATFNQMTAQLRETLAGLEQRVADRTRALALSGEVSRRLSTILNQNQLVSEVVEQLHESFNFYHVQIYLFDTKRENLVMMGGTGEAGKILLQRGHQIPHGRGLVGRAAETNLPVLVPDVTKDSNWLPNSLLPDTLSELAVPIAVGERVLGVLDVQQSIADSLKSEDADLVQSIANQVAIALQNTRSYIEAQQQAEHEALINAISQKIRSTDNVELALQVAAREIGRALNLPHTRVKLGATATTTPSNGGSLS